jgi:hypothetical protein
MRSDPCSIESMERFLRVTESTGCCKGVLSRICGKRLYSIKIRWAPKNLLCNWIAAVRSITRFTRERTSCEHINSQAKKLGIERPKVRNRRSVVNLNIVIYLTIKVCALNRAKSINKGLLQIS